MLMTFSGLGKNHDKLIGKKKSEIKYFGVF